MKIERLRNHFSEFLKRLDLINDYVFQTIVFIYNSNRELYLKNTIDYSGFRFEYENYNDFRYKDVSVRFISPWECQTEAVYDIPVSYILWLHKGFERKEFDSKSIPFEKHPFTKSVIQKREKRESDYQEKIDKMNKEKELKEKEEYERLKSKYGHN